MLTGIRRKNALSRSMGRLVAPRTTTGASDVDDKPSHSDRNAPRGIKSGWRDATMYTREVVRESERDKVYRSNCISGFVEEVCVVGRALDVCRICLKRV